jgi:hypothetical protein
MNSYQVGRLGMNIETVTCPACSGSGIRSSDLIDGYGEYVYPDCHGCDGKRKVSPEQARECLNAMRHSNRRHAMFMAIAWMALGIMLLAILGFFSQGIPAQFVAGAIITTVCIFLLYSIGDSEKIEQAERRLSEELHLRQ